MGLATWNKAATTAKDRADLRRQVSSPILPEESLDYDDDDDDVEPLFYSLHLFLSDILGAVAIVVFLSSPM